MAGTAPLKSLNAVTAPGNGTTFDVQRATSNWEVQITTTGSPASFACHLEGAIDGSTLVTIGSSITATGLTNVTSNTPVTMVRLVLDSLTGGTAPTVTGVIVGDGPAGSGGGGGGAATIAAGADVTEGNTTDAKVTGDNAGTVSAKLRGLLYEFGDQADAAAGTDAGTFSFLAFVKRLLQKFTTQFPAALGGTVAANSFPVALASDGTFATQTGSVTETAPATDIASSGLNGRLQRIAQRLTSLIALLPSALVSGRLDVNVGATVTPANVALDATVTTTNTEIGGLTEAAPASDTASSGLNGRLQRVAQRLTSLIALLPASIGSKTAAGSLGVALATDEPLIGSLTEAAPGTDTASSGLNGRLQRIAQNITTMIAAILKVQGGVASGAAASGENPVLIAGSDGAGNVLTPRVSASVTDGLAPPSSLFADAFQSDFNGANWDRRRNNLDVTLLTSASRSTTQSPANITTYNAGAIKVIVDTTVLPGAAISNVVTINEVDPASGKSILLLTGAAIVGVSTNEYTVDPMIPAVANVTAQKRVPRTINVVITSGNGNSATYSVGYLLLPA